MKERDKNQNSLDAESWLEKKGMHHAESRERLESRVRIFWKPLKYENAIWRF